MAVGGDAQRFWVQYEHKRTIGPVTFFYFIDMWCDIELRRHFGVWVGRFRVVF